MTDKILSVTTYISSGCAIILGFLNEYAAAFGVLIALATFGLNFWFKWQEINIAWYKYKKEKDGNN